MSQQEQFDVIVIGGGPGGYPAAIAAAQAGASVALIEKEHLGGVCLNWGCIPTKTLIANANVITKLKHAKDFGITVDNFSFDFGTMTKRKDAVVGKLRDGLGMLIAANKISLFRGYGQFLSAQEIKISGDDNAIITGKKIIIATGSRPKEMAAFPFDHKQVLSSDSILDLKKLPKSLVIIGGGVIGCEFASLYSRLDVDVTILEALPTIISMEAANIVSELTKHLSKSGIKIQTNVMVEGIDRHKKGISVRLAKDKAVEAEIALVAVGRALNTSGIGLEKAGVVVETNGVIPTNDKMETNVPGIYAIGDITGQWLLAHVASHQGLVAASNATGTPRVMHYDAVPSVIFTTPEIGTVGMSLEKALEKGYQATVSAFPFQALGKSQAILSTEGYAQLVVDKPTGQILGAQVIGHEAATLIAEMTVAIANELTVDCIVETIHAHPTIAEVWLEAAMMANDSPLHLPPVTRKNPHAS